MPNPPHRSSVTDSEADEPEIKPCGLCLQCVHACPTGALQYHNRVWSLNLRLCVYCRDCAAVCPNSLISGLSA
jgi:Fe-S-cluster-containing hydrogenase component 2